MTEKKLGKYYIDKSKVIEDFKSLKAFAEQYKVNKRQLHYGLDNLEAMQNVPSEYILERDFTPKIYSEIDIDFVTKKEKATHILKNQKGRLLCKKV